MSQNSLTPTEEAVLESRNRLKSNGHLYGRGSIHKDTGIPKSTVKNILRRLSARGYFELGQPGPNFTFDELPSELPCVDTLIQQRKEQFNRKRMFEKAHELINVNINIDGPIGIVHMGDPHLMMMDVI